MFDKLQKIWKIKDVRNRVLFVIGMMVIFRLTAHIPIPGIDTASLREFLSGNQILGLLNLFSGGTIENFSLVMLGVAPYITASIIFQLLVMVVPQLEELSKEGESGQQKINMYTRLATIPLALLQAFALIQLLSQSGQGILGDLSTARFAFMLLTVTAGTVFLMWIGELITEKNVGNGISLLIFAAIVSALPTTAQNLIVNYNASDLYTYVLFLAVAIVTIVGVVFITEGQRNIPVSYAKQRGIGGTQSHLPLRVNMAGVIPIIFAISLVLFPPMIAQFFAHRADWLGTSANFVIDAFNNQLIYGLVYFILVFGFTYFYTAIIFKPDKIAENLQRQGGFIPGIRPGKQTEEYLTKIMNRLVFSGATFLAAIAVMPVVVQAMSGIQSLAIGGMSLLIIVSVGIEIAKQIDSQIMMHEYDKV
jgi:preprotein translocase subunit SecY